MRQEINTADSPFGTNSSCSDRKSTRLNSSHSQISYAVFCLKKQIAPDRADVLPPLRQRQPHRRLHCGGPRIATRPEGRAPAAPGRDQVSYKGVQVWTYRD